MMGSPTIDRLIINSPFEEPKEHWRYDPATRTFERVPGRRPAGYVVATAGSKSFDDPGIFYELPLVNQIRERVREWRAKGYPGVTGVTRRLLEHWTNPEERPDGRRFFFCQLEAIETLIWLTEAPPADRVGIEIPSDGGPFRRLCSKMATGTGKTIVMAMLIAWQILNKVTYPQDTRFSKYILVVAPGLTVRNRLQVLVPSAADNYYDAFHIVPSGMVDRLHQGKVLVRNWHALSWETAEQIARRRSVDKRGPKSDEAYIRDVLGEMASARNLVVINDEAHHAWRVPAESKVKGVRKEDIEQATRWVGGLDRIHRARGILACYDFTATPFAPSGKASSEEALFGWIVSDFGLNDAIESGLVKTPRVVIRDNAVPDARSYRSRLYHIYMDPDVKDDLNRRAAPSEPLPDLVRNAYLLLGADWLATKREWEVKGAPTPPVMITVCNRTETAARVKYAFDHQRILVPELCDPERTLHIDSKVLEMAEEREEAIALNGVTSGPDTDGDGDDGEDGAPKRLTREQRAELLRRMVDTVGQPGQPGAHIQHVISVGMLSEGWDAKTVTHIMGLRAFSSQLLCEQVVGRGLRRTSYEPGPDGLLEPEYVNVFGVPFSFLPHEGGDGSPPPPPQPTTRVEPVSEKQLYEITFPNIVRIEHVFRPKLELDPARVRPLVLDAADTVTSAELGAVLEGRPSLAGLTEVEIAELGRRLRTQQVLFRTAAAVFDELRPEWKGPREYLLAQVVALVERFLASGHVVLRPASRAVDETWRRVMVTVHMNKIVQHLWDAIRVQSVERRVPVFDDFRPIRSTGDMRPWYTKRPVQWTRRSHINVCVCDSPWEASEAYELDHNPYVSAWVKNDHLGFEIPYIDRGVRRKYRPDFLVRLINGVTLVIEVKGQQRDDDQAKWAALDEWVSAVNDHGGFGQWAWGVARSPGEVAELIARHARGAADDVTAAESFDQAGSAQGA